MKKSTLFFIILTSILVGCATPQVTVTSEATVTLPPTETPIPAPTLSPQFAALQETIASSGNRFTLNAADGLVYDGAEPVPGLHVAPDGTMSLTVDGETLPLDPANVSFDDEIGITIDGYAWDEETGAWVEASVVSETAVTTEIEGNPFSGVGIELDGKNYENNPVLSQEDLSAMRDVIEQLYVDGKIEQFGDPNEPYGPMQLGTKDLTIRQENSDAIKKIGMQPMYNVSSEDLQTYKWDKSENLPRIIGFPFEKGGVIFASLILDKTGKAVVQDWIWTPQALIDSWPADGISDDINYTGSAVNRLVVPHDFATVEACMGFVKNDPNAKKMCEQVVAQRLEMRALQKQKLESGIVPEKLGSGELISIFSAVSASK